MREEIKCQIGEKVRVKKVSKYGVKETEYKYGIVKEIDAIDISYHGSPFYVNAYTVEYEDGSKEKVGYLSDLDDGRYSCTKTYICPVPTKERVVEQVDEKIQNLNQQIAVLQKQAEELKGFKFDVLNDMIALTTIDYIL